MTDDITISSEQATSLADVGHEEIRGILKRRKEAEEVVHTLLKEVDNETIDPSDFFTRMDDGGFYYQGELFCEGRLILEAFDVFFPCEADWIEFIYSDDLSNTRQRIKIRDKDLARSCWIKLEEKA